MNDNRFALVEFQGDRLLTIFDGQTVRVAMKPMVELLGIDWPSQHKRIQRDPLLSEGMVIMTIPSERGMQETATLPIELMHGWLFTLTVSKVREDARQRILAYQRECYQVLHDYWVKGAAINPRAAPIPGAASVNDLIRLSEQVKAETNPVLREAFYGMLQQGFAARGIETPPIEAISLSYNDDIEAARALERIDRMVREQPALDWHRSDAYIAVRMLDLARSGFSMSKPVKAALRRHPRFVDVRSVNSPVAKSVWCWVFRAA